MIDDEETNEQEQPEKKKSVSSTVKIIVIAVVLTLFVGGGLVAGTYYFVSSMNPDEKASTDKKDKKDEEEDEEDEDEEDEEEGDDEEDEEDSEEDEEDSESNNKDKPAQYLPMDPKFVVSFHDQKTARFMQFEIEVMSRDKKTFEVINLHSAAIRSSLLMLFGGQNSDVMSTREGKQMLLDETVKDINATLVKITGKKSFKSAVEAAYFNSFVIQ